jgi:thioredoxin 1
MAIIDLVTSEFDAFVEENEFAVIEFGAQWCSPCQSFQKVLAALQADYGEFAFASVDIDQEVELAEEFGVRSVPFIMIMRKRTVVYADSGALSRSAMAELLEQARALGDDV